MEAKTTATIDHQYDDLNVPTAQREIAAAWEWYRQSAIKHYRDGLEFGRICYQWQIRYKAQGSRKGKGFEHLLQGLNIPKTTAYRWIKRYEIKCEHRANRHDVDSTRARQGTKSPILLTSVPVTTSFTFVLSKQQLRDFQEDVKLLGGERRVSAMFLKFLREKALEARSVAVTAERCAPGQESMAPSIVVAS
jgi:hypothetical protein